MDGIEYAIENTYDFHSSCRNCNIKSRQLFDDGGFYCTGIVKYPLKELPFDVIRFCTLKKESDEQVDIIDYSPDEALVKSSMLSESSHEWLVNQKPYIKFRGLSSDA